MKVLFSMRHSGALRNFASTVEELARRGHHIHLVFMMRDKLPDQPVLADLSGAFPTVTHEYGCVTPCPWLALARRVRAAADYVRYRSPEFRDAVALRDRAEARVSPRVQRVSGLPLVRTRAGLKLLTAALHLVDRTIPADPAVIDLVMRQKPDVLLVTPLIDLASDQVEYVKAARFLGIPCGLCVHSWDNLTNKGVIHILPDRVFVWNDTQRREAVRLHDVPEDRVVVTGAPTYDQWFARRPSTTRDDFCRKVGLPVTRPYFLYLCSSKFIAPHEAHFVMRWIRALRAAADPRVRESAVLVRPHPRGDKRGWTDGFFADLPDVVVWPPDGANPVDAASRNDYFDSLYHSAAAIGINTSAQIEAGIVGRAVYSIRAPEYQATQEGTLHFHYLLREHGGLVHLASSLEEHTHALAAALQRGAEEEQRLRAFVQGFVRPQGLGVAATPLLADAIEQLARLSVQAGQDTTIATPALQLALYPVARRMKIEHRVARRGSATSRTSGERLRKKGQLVH